MANDGRNFPVAILEPIISDVKTKAYKRTEIKTKACELTKNQSKLKCPPTVGACTPTA